MQTVSKAVEFSAMNFAECLEELKPLIGSYDWIWQFLRRRMRKSNLFPNRSFRLILRYFNRGKPLFVGTTRDGIKFLGDARDDYSVIWAMNNAYDDAVITLLKKAVANTDGVYIDIGANMGLFAATIASSLAEGGQVIAFEPILETARRAAATFALNKLSNVKLLQMAIGSEDGELSLMVAPGYSAQASAHYMDKVDTNITSTRVPCRTLDSLLDENLFQRVDILKIDVEGHELNAIMGAQSLIKQHKPKLIFEFNPHIVHKAGWHPQDITSVIQKLADYQFQVLHDDKSLTSFPPPANLNEVVNVYGECAS